MVSADKVASLIEERPLEHDPSFFGVKVSDRPVRDVFFGIIFLLNMAAVTVISFYSFSVGDLSTNNPICQANPNDYFGQAVTFLEQKSQLLAISGAIALGFGIVWLFLLRLFTKVAIYVTLAAAVGVVIAGGIYLIRFDDFDIKIAGYVLFAVAALMVLVIFFMRRKIALTAACVSEACKALQSNPSSIPIAFAILAVIVAFITMWVVSLVRLNCIPSLGNDSHRLRYLFLFLIFGGFWVILFLLAVLRTSIAGGVAVWYFSRNSQFIHQDMPMFPMLSSLKWSLSSSFGSLALGSLFLAIIATIRVVLYRAEKAAGANQIAKIILSCLRCCCACIFSLVRQLNEFAYVYVAMYGTSFVDSAKKVFSLIGRNPISTVMVETLTNLVLMFGRILGTLVSILIVMAILGEDIHHPVSWVVVLSGIVAFVVLSIFSTVISCAVDSIFICYCEDLERNRESGRYLMDPDLHQTLQSAAPAKGYNV